MATVMKTLFLTYLTASFIFHHGYGARCSNESPSIEQTQVGFGEPPRFMVQVKNNCPMCPVINVHIQCGGFSQKLASPKLFRVISYNDCVANDGLPLPPLQTISFNYSHHKFNMSPKSWFFQCE